ncbi:hypothetical protein EDC04DRAFT_2896803 [Pisolithus marmoratus]|nr:hypothetical protein EDC04DRAFT_2896803 [Pisolithus marmoratus]
MHLVSVRTSTSLSEQKVEFIQCPTESLGFIADEGVDLVIAARSYHWFDWSRVWPKLARTLRKGGTAAAWVCHFLFIDYWSLNNPDIVLNNETNTSFHDHRQYGRVGDMESSKGIEIECVSLL